MGERLDPLAHTSAGWLAGELLDDFRLLDVWGPDIEGSQAEFGELPAAIGGAVAGQETDSRVSNSLFAVREFLGRKFHLDDDELTLPIPGCRESSLRDRLSADITGRDVAPVTMASFRQVYLTDDEWMLELSNRTVHAAIHFGWVPIDGDRCRAQFAIYVKPRGRLGRAYMAFISPFRHWLIYPALMRSFEGAWRDRATSSR